jgi:hypothetical protein
MGSKAAEITYVIAGERTRSREKARLISPDDQEKSEALPNCGKQKRGLVSGEVEIGGRFAPAKNVLLRLSGSPINHDQPTVATPVKEAIPIVEGLIRKPGS